MEPFKFNYTTDPTILERGEAINRYISLMWVERYRDPGEFEIVGRLSSGLGGFLKIGTLISHEDTMEVMIVENQEIKETGKEDPEIRITGRSFESYLENRIVGTNQARSSNNLVEYSLVADYTWNQAVKLINDHIQNTQTPNDALVNITASTQLSGASGTSELRVIKRANLHQSLLELLAIDDLGIKTIRRNPFNAPGGLSNQTILSIFNGLDKSASVIFSWKAGDLENAEYLWSDKKRKNSALVLGRYVNVVVDQGPTKYDRRFMLVDATDLDGDMTAPPTGTALTTLVGKMQTRGRQALKSQELITITRTDVADISRYQYRRDYNVGDMVTLDGNFGQMAKMRVVEYVEIEDETGESGHPTLSVPQDETGTLLTFEIPL